MSLPACLSLLIRLKHIERIKFNCFNKIGTQRRSRNVRYLIQLIFILAELHN